MLKRSLTARNQILLLLDLEDDRSLLTGWLGQDYDVISLSGADLKSQVFDLAILDLPNLKRFGQIIQSWKESTGSVFLPFLLIGFPQEADLISGQFPQVVDEVLLTPVQKSELLSRVANLLKRRELSEFLARGRSGIKTCDGALAKVNEELQQKTEALKKAQSTLDQLQRHLLLTREWNQALIQAKDDSSLLNRICRVIVEAGGHFLAWVDVLEHDEPKTVAQFGDESGYCQKMGHGLSVSAIRSHEPTVRKNLPMDPNCPPRQGDAVQPGFGSCLALPLIVSGLPAMALNILTTEPDGFGAEELGFLTELADDLASGLINLSKKSFQKRLETEVGLNLLETATGAIFVVDSEGALIYFNETTCQRLGLGRQELLSLNMQQLLNPLTTNELAQRLTDLATRNELIFETKSFRKDGSVLPLEIHARVMDFQGRPMILSIARDISARKQAEEINARTEAQLRQVQKMEALATFAGGIAHEFNNVLGAIKGNIELAGMNLQGIPGTEKIQAKLDAALRGGERAGDLVKQILTFSRRRMQKARPVEILPIVKESLKLLRASIPTSIEIRQKLHPQSGLVLAEPQHISQILLNLTSNAFHAIEEQGGVMEIGLEPVEVDAALAGTILDLHEGPYVKLTVSDTGHGMDQETLRRIFEPFFTTKKVGEGNGLGLSVIHGIIKELGGAVQVFSELGQGTNCMVYLPSYQTPPPKELPSSEAVSRGTEHILLVDDEAPIVQIQQEYLQRLGYKVSAFTSSIKAWEEFSAEPEKFDLIITDLTMPGMNGIELSESVLRLRPGTRIILATGYTETEFMDRAKKLGIQQCLMKPMVLAQLGLAVRRELENNPGSKS